MTEQFPDGFRDCVSDVLAMVEAYMLAQQDDDVQAATGLGDFRFLMAQADKEGCLRVAVPLLVTGWTFASSAQAQLKGTSPEQEMAHVLALFREQLLRAHWSG